MCGIFCTNKQIPHQIYPKINYFLKFRGPDRTNIISYEDHIFMQDLLHLTGEPVVQPFVKGNIICLYNGEIYNYRDFGTYRSDGECLIDLYEKYGETFPQQLDGEFAIILYDYDRRLILIATDLFKTKPLFYSCDGRYFGCSSFSSPLAFTGHTNIMTMAPNSIRVFDMNRPALLREHVLHRFDLEQYKTGFEDWQTAFEKAVAKRVCNTKAKIFLGLSSGYDSGAICCELLKTRVAFSVYSVFGTEVEEVLEARLGLVQKSGICMATRLYKTEADKKRVHEYILSHTEDFQYTICSSSSDYNEFHLKLYQDGGANWLALVCEKAKQDGCKINFSGAGADEIFSDYGFNGQKLYPHSNFGGLFPDDLAGIFPWNSFYHSSMESYLAKEEYVAGSYGLETRYPFLDKAVVQEFLWLHPTLKNSKYKSVLDHYLEQNQFPFASGCKVGF